MSGETGICRMCGDTVDFHSHHCHPYIIDNSTWIDKIRVNGRMSKKLFEKVITPKLKELENLKANADKCYCAFCSDNIERTWDDLKSHMLICEKHPLFIANKELETTKRLLDEAHRNISEQNPMSYEEEIEWLRQYEEMRAK